jgi:predicted ribosomally synthesized peptide with nif11-like leader
LSEQGVTALLERVQSDPGSRERLEAAPDNETRRQVVRDAGLDVAPSGLPTLRSLAGLQELSDEDLEKVAGGAGTGTQVATGIVAGATAAAAAIAALM